MIPRANNAVQLLRARSKTPRGETEESIRLSGDEGLFIANLLEQLQRENAELRERLESIGGTS